MPLIIAGIVGRYAFKLNYYTLIGVLSGATTNPPALAYSNEQTSCDAPAVGYATVYPLTMFLRVLTAQLLILSLLFPKCKKKCIFAPFLRKIINKYT